MLWLKLSSRPILPNRSPNGHCAEALAIGTKSSDGDTTLPPKDCLIANNVVESIEGPLIDVINTPENMLYQGNILFGAATGLPATPGVTVVDPLLSLAADGLMRPAINSPVANGAEGSYPTITVDMDGEPRVVGSQDAGADEVMTSAPLVTPLGPDDVGPRWMRPNILLIAEVTSSLTEAVVTFEDVTGLSPVYSLERRIDLPTGMWTAIASFVPAACTSTVFSIMDTNANPDSAYYRVVNQ